MFARQYRAIAERGAYGDLQIPGQIDLGFSFRNRRVLGVTQMAIPDGPVACRADIGMRAVRIDFRNSMKTLEAFCEIASCARNIDHERTRSNTRPRNQKLSTPAHSA